MSPLTAHMKNNKTEASHCLNGVGNEPALLASCSKQLLSRISLKLIQQLRFVFFNVKMNVFSLACKQMPYYLKDTKAFLLSRQISSVPEFMVLLYLVIFVYLDKTQNMAQPLFVDYDVVFAHW